MRTGLAGLAGAAVSSRTPLLRSQSVNEDVQAVSRSSLKKLVSIPTTCQQCPSGCGIVAHLDGDRCVQLSGNPVHPVNRGAICATGIAGLNLVYDPDRLLFPLKRAGERGSGNWTRITWDEAYQILVSQLKNFPFSGPRSEMVFDMGLPHPILDRFIESLGGAAVIERQRLNQASLDLATLSTTGSGQLIPDVRRSRTILNFGANPFAHHDFFIGLAKRIGEAVVEQGAKLFTFDVRMSETAAKSSAWFPVRAGTDGIVALSMAHVILKKNLADRDFISRMTNSSWQDLENHLAPFTPDKAEEISGVKADWIERTAVTFASQKPSVAFAGGGAADHENGVQTVRCVLLLNWLVGNLNSDGGLHLPTSPPATPSPSSKSLNPNLWLKGTSDLIANDSEIDFYFAFRSNPSFDEFSCQNVENYLRQEKNVHFLAVMDIHLTETAALADLVLPAATPLECWGLGAAPSFDRMTILNLRQPVVSLLSPARVLRSPDFEAGKITASAFMPRGEAKDLGDVCISLARRMGGRATGFFPFKNVKEFVSLEASKISGLSDSGGFETLKREGFWLKEKDESRFTKPGLREGLKPVSIVLETSQPEIIPVLPDYEEIKTHKERDENELILTSYKTGLNDRNTANSKWLREISHENCLWINRRTAEKRGIANGDRVQITSSAGSLIAQALVTDRIHPESVALAEGFGHTATGNFARARKIKSKERDTDLVWWSKSGPGVNIKTIIGLQKESISGAFVGKDTLVRINKISKGGLK